MTRDEILKMAREVGITFDPRWGMCTTGNVQIERFARAAYAAGAAAEREACAKVCEDEAEKWEGDDGPISTEARLCAINIRARGQA